MKQKLELYNPQVVEVLKTNPILAKMYKQIFLKNGIYDWERDPMHNPDWRKFQAKQELINLQQLLPYDSDEIEIVLLEM